MAPKWPLGLVFIAFGASASSMSDEAIQLNQEMEWLLKVAPEAHVYADPANAPVARPGTGNGLAPTQMKDIDRSEDRYFSDEVTFQAAASEDSSAGEDTELLDSESVDNTFKMDGRPPRRRR